MAKHTVTAMVDGVEYKIETDADRFMVGTVFFNFDVPAPSSNSAESVPARTRFRAKITGLQTVHRKIACIAAVRRANGCDLAEARTVIESGAFFLIHAERRVEFETYCNENGLIVTYL